MLTLGIDLCLTEGNITVGKNGEPLSTVSWNIPKIHSEVVFQEIEHSLNLCGQEKENIKRVIVTTGPGSFTGVRLSVTVGKAFKCCGIEVFGISTLKALILGYENLEFTPIPLIYAKRGRFYSMINGKFLDETEQNLLELIKTVSAPLIIYKGIPPQNIIKTFPSIEENSPLSQKIISLPQDKLSPLTITYIRNHDAKPKNS